MTSYSLVNATAVLPTRILEHATIVVEEGTIRAVGYQPGRGKIIDLAGRWVLPGFIDLHVHGGGGASFSTIDPDEIDTAAGYHRQHGTTTMHASLVSESTDQLKRALTAIAKAPSRRVGGIVGVHLEGPFLSRDRPGCHELVHLIPPDPAVLAELLDTGPGLVTAMTVAPEVPGAEEVISLARTRGVVVGIGHSDADHDQAARAFRHGVTVVTHAYQAMREIQHRAPGIVGAALETRGVFLELIADLVHNHSAIIAMTFAAARGRIALITDAAPAAGMPAGYLSHTGSAPVVIDQDGRVVRRDSGVLAGSALTMDTAVRNCLALGLDLVDVAHAAATAPAQAIGIHTRTGSIAPGLAADLVILDHSFALAAVVKDGRPARDDGTLCAIPAHALAAVR